MKKTKTYFTNEVEKQVDEITNQYLNGLITEDVAVKNISSIDNLELVGLTNDNISDHLFYATEDAKEGK